MPKAPRLLFKAYAKACGSVPWVVGGAAIASVEDDVREAGRKTAGLDDLHLTLTRLLGEQHMVFEESWQRLTLPQRAVLRALVIEEGRELMSADVRSRHRLPVTSTIQAALAALLRQDIITKDNSRYVTVDSLYREWVARKTY